MSDEEKRPFREIAEWFTHALLLTSGGGVEEFERAIELAVEAAKASAWIQFLSLGVYADIIFESDAEIAARMKKRLEGK